MKTGPTAHRAHEGGACPFSSKLHPEPAGDYQLRHAWGQIDNDHHKTIRSYNAYFAFSGPDQYFRWFHTPQSRAILSSLGFQLTILSIPDEYVSVGATQVIYDKTKAVRVASIPCGGPKNAIYVAWTQLQPK